MNIIDQQFERIPPSVLVLSGFRSVLTSATYSTCSDQKSEQLVRIARLASHSATLSDSNASGLLGSPTSALLAAKTLADTISKATSVALFKTFHSVAMVNGGSQRSFSSTFSSSFSSEASDFFTTAISKDTDAIEKFENAAEVFQRQLGEQGALHGEQNVQWQRFAARPDPDNTWQFWRDWYQGMLDGTPMDWDLQLQVALIKDAVWEAGPKAVAKEIQRIQTEFMSTKLPQAETLSREDDSLYTVSSAIIDPDEMIDRIFTQLDFSLTLALRGHNSSGFNEMCVAYAYLVHTRNNCRDDPNAVHMHLRLAREVIEGKLAAQEYHREDALIALVSALGQHELQLRADHPMIRQKHDTYVSQRLRELDDEKRIQIAAEFRALEPNTQGRLRTEFGLDAKTLATDTGIEAQRDALKRAGGRSQKMNLIERAANATKSADGSALNKGTGLIMRLQKIAELLSPLL